MMTPSPSRPSRPQMAGLKLTGTAWKVFADAVSGLELFRDAANNGTIYVRVTHLDGRQAFYRARSQQLRRHLLRQYHARQKLLPMADLRQLVENIEAAGSDAPTIVAATRVGRFEDRIYLDLADDAGRVVAIGPDGWRVVNDAPVHFIRQPGMMPLPVPLRGGNVKDLRRHLNLVDDRQLLMILAWLVGALNPDGPFPVLAFTGEQGTGKTLIGRLLRKLIDPNEASARSSPRSEHDLAIAAEHGWAMILDNLGSMPDWLSDALCRLSTTGGYATRQLYTDDAERRFQARRPIVLNGIEHCVNRGDLLDRCLLVDLPRIDKANRRPEMDILAEFDADHPRLLGALLTAVSTALRRLPVTRVGELPRMADFARWVMAAEPAFDLPGITFADAYAANVVDADAQTIESVPAGAAIWKLVSKPGYKFNKTAADLLECLPDSDRSPQFPRTPEAIARQLRRIAPSLGRKNIHVEFYRVSGGWRHVKIENENPKEDSSAVLDTPPGQ